MTRTESLMILHGYHLDGSGSCVYVQNVVRELARQGVDVVLLCQEPEIEQYDFVSEAYQCRAKKGMRRFFEQETEYDGKVTYIRPHLRNGLLPVFVGGKFPGFENVKPFYDLSDAELESYIKTSLDAVLEASEQFGAQTIFANHIVMTPYIALRACQKKPDMRYFLIPHGSEIEYLIKKDSRYHDLAVEVLQQAAGIVSGSREMIERINAHFAESEKFSHKYHFISVGVDVDHFAEPLKISKTQRAAKLEKEIKLQQSGETSGINAVNPDFLAGLQRIDPENDRLIVNFGKLIPAKGVQDLILLAPDLLIERPELRIVIAGDGPHRKLFEKLVMLLQNGDSVGFLSTVDEDSRQSAETFDDPYRFISGFFEQRSIKQYFQDAASSTWADRVLFAGYLKHPALRYLLCLSDVAVFPSIVKEAYPLALLEAMGTGVFPTGSDFGGLRDGFGQLDGLFSAKVAARMKIPMEEQSRIASMRDNIVAALDFHDDEIRLKMVEQIERNCSWKTVCRKLRSTFSEKEV